MLLRTVRHQFFGTPMRRFSAIGVRRRICYPVSTAFKASLQTQTHSQTHNLPRKVVWRIRYDTLLL